MKLAIDTLDGQGARDYTAALDRTGRPFEIVRTLNAPSRLRAGLQLYGSTLPVPPRQARVTVTTDAGTTLFTGYVTTEPVAVPVGVASEGPVYRLELAAVSDEWLLDKQSAGLRAGASLAVGAGSVVRGLAGRVDPTRIATAGMGNGRSVGVFSPAADAVWSGHVGAVADATYAAYRVVNGAATLAPAGAVLHQATLAPGAVGPGALALSGLTAGHVRELANDVTLSGAEEPGVYWTELFRGDGTTAAFSLTGEPAALGLGRALLLVEDFNLAALDRNRWAATDPGSHLGLGAGGLALTGGNGFDGQTTLTANDAVELGGTLVLTLRGVTLGGASAGMLGGLYAGTAVTANCVAGFHVRQSSGSTVVTPLVNGAETGTSFTLTAGHAYTLRLRLHAPELVRVGQAYYARVNGQVAQFGGDLTDSPLALVFELRDEGTSSNTPVTVLYDGALQSSPAAATLVAVNSLQLFGAVGSVRLERTGTAWVTTTAAATGVQATRLTGLQSDGVDCAVQGGSAARVLFYPGQVPAAGDLIAVSYRGRRRAVARVADVASVAREAAGGAVGTARFAGSTARPHARTAEDCENAAAAVLALAGDRAAAVAGTCTLIVSGAPGTQPQSDLWPGDLLEATDAPDAPVWMLRTVKLEERGAAPEELIYKLAFANDWAEGLGLKLSATLAVDALVPAVALDSTTLAGRWLPSLSRMRLTAATGSSSSAGLSVDAGVDAPQGGGFEVRRRDGGFGSGSAAGASGDLVLRSPVRGFSIPRGTFEERFLVRPYDAQGRTARQSWGLVTHLPLQ